MKKRPVKNWGRKLSKTEKERLDIANREICTGSLINLFSNQVVVFPLEVQLANLNGKTLKEPLLIEEFD